MQNSSTIFNPESGPTPAKLTDRLIRASSDAGYFDSAVCPFVNGRRCPSNPVGDRPAGRSCRKPALGVLDALRTRRHLGYRESMEWARDAGTVVDEITAAALSAPSRELLKLVELAINQVVKVILHDLFLILREAVENHSCNL